MGALLKPPDHNPLDGSLMPFGSKATLDLMTGEFHLASPGGVMNLQNDWNEHLGRNCLHKMLFKA